MEDVTYLDNSTDGGVVMMERLLYRPSEVAHLFGISRSQLYVLMAAGSIKAVKIGRSTRFTKKAIENFVADLRELIPAELDGDESEEEE